MLAAGMEGISKQHATGYTCHMCGGVAVVDIERLVLSKAVRAHIEE
jgi:hypothetical protein